MNSFNNEIKTFRGSKSCISVVGLLGVLLLLFPLRAWSVSSSSQATMRVAEPLTIISTLPLEFGQVRPGDTSGTVEITVQNERFAAGGAEAVASSTLWNRGEFLVTGEPDQGYTIALQSSTAIHDMGGQNASLNVTNLLAFSVNKDAIGTEGFINLAGSDLIFIGGTLQVPDKSIAKNGKYEGEVTITINF